MVGGWNVLLREIILLAEFYKMSILFSCIKLSLSLSLQVCTELLSMKYWFRNTNTSYTLLQIQLTNYHIYGMMCKIKIRKENLILHRVIIVV